MQQFLCPACGALLDEFSENLFIPSARGIKPWKRCSECKAYFMIEPYEAEQELRHLKSKPWGQYCSGKQLGIYRKRMFLSVINAMKKNCSFLGSILDIGCSYGEFLMEAIKAGYIVYGVDINPDAIEYVKSKGIPAEVCSSLSQLKGIKEASIDVITCLDINYYWCNQPLELKHAYLKLKSGGCLVMRTADKSWLFSLGLFMRKLQSNIGEWLIRRAAHDHRFSMPVHSLLSVIRASGFDVIYTSTLAAIPSYKTNLLIKLCYMIGSVFWRICKFNLAPGMLIIAKKTR